MNRAGQAGQVAAIDLGATSGRVILATVGADTLDLTEVARFGNGPMPAQGGPARPDGLDWDLPGLFDHACMGLDQAMAGMAGDRESALLSIGVDSWAVDFGLVAGGGLLAPVRHYRDPINHRGVNTLQSRISAAELFARNGLQHLDFTTCYQLAATDPALLARAEHLLLVPDLIGHWLTGQTRSELTNASTTGLVLAQQPVWDTELMAHLGLVPALLPALIAPGQVLGELTGSWARRWSPSAVVTAVGSHDTASAVVAVPMDSPGAVYISCGTWALVGVEVGSPILTEPVRAAGFTNERGVDDQIRLLTNVMGLWLLNELISEWGAEGPVDLQVLLQQAALLPIPVDLIEVDDPVFAAPGPMVGRITSWLSERGLASPPSRAQFVRLVIESLAVAMVQAARTATELAGQPLTVIHLVGGGARNQLLCQRLADHSGVPVLAGPVEATAVGNVLIQARTVGLVQGNVTALRELVARTHPPRKYLPRP